MKPEKQLYQWDVNQYLIELQPTAEFVDYPIGNEVIRLETDGTRCRIPDEVLQTYGGKTCYERYPDGTYRAYSFTVLYSPKPPDYVYTPEERTTFEALTARVDSAIEEIKRRADSGEFTPVKGVDYFTDAEKNEMMESVSSGAVGEFRKVVDTATTEYNDNHNFKLDKYNANAAEKLTTYDTNAEQHTTDYNRNAAEKLEAYNQNHAAKVAEYNQNAETKTAEFDSNAAALQTEVDRLRGECDKLAAEKANIDGYYEEMTVGDAEQLVATQFVEDNEPYLFRSTGGSSDVGNRAYIDQIVGGTVAWNQHVNGYDTVDITHTTSGGVVTITPTSSSNMFIAKENRDNISVVNGHKYLATVEIKSDGEHNVGFQNYLIGGVKKTNSATWTQLSIIVNATSTGRVYFQLYSTSNTVYQIKDGSFNVIDLTQMFGSTIADYIYSIEQSQAGAGVEWFKKLFPKDYYPYNTGELISVEGLQSHDMVGFNQWDEEWEVGYLGYSSSNEGQPIPMQKNTIRSKNFIKVLPNTSYYFNYPIAEVHYVWEYDENKNALRHYQLLASGNNNQFTTPSDCRYIKFACEPTYGTTYKHDICINLSSPSRNGEYEPYKKHSYPLDSSLTLRGIPKLDASNNIYYDGDEYISGGKVKRKYGVIDLGTISWSKGGSNNKTSWVPVSWRTNVKPVQNTDILANILCTKYYTDTSENVEKQVNDKTIAVNKSAWVYIYDSAYVNATPQEFKTAMSGVMLVYELATPTTETAEPFQHTQIVDDFGTEEFVSTGIVPVGHNTRYPANLRDKLQHLPSLASADGTYMIQQSGKQMSLVHMPAVFPDTPTEDGTYTLKTVVTGGVTTLQWVAE